jgi:2-enoyl-CoA hydratase-like protein
VAVGLRGRLADVGSISGPCDGVDLCEPWARRSRGGPSERCGRLLAMSIDRDIAVGVRWPKQDFQWSAVDVRGYHRAVGRTDGRDTVLPTFAMTAPGMFGVASPEFYGPQPPEISFPGIRLHLAGLLHGQQEIVVHRPIPLQGALRSGGQVVDVGG